MDNEKVSIKSPGKRGPGGAQPGAGRPKGSGNKLTVNTLLKTLDAKLGKPYEEQLADNYINALGDPKLVYQYDVAFMGKAMADRHQVEVDDSSTVESRQAAFLKAFETIGAIAQSHSDESNDDN